MATDNTIDNLKLDQLTPEERHELTKKGGRKSAEVRKRKKNIQQCMKMMMDSDIPPTMEKARKNLSAYGIKDEDMTYAVAVSAAMLQKAIQGNVKAAEFVRDTGGFNPDLLLKKEIFNHEKQMDRIRLGQNEIKKSDTSDLIKALEGTEVEDVE